MQCASVRRLVALAFCVLLAAGCGRGGGEPPKTAVPRERTDPAFVQTATGAVRARDFTERRDVDDEVVDIGNRHDIEGADDGDAIEGGRPRGVERAFLVEAVVRQIDRHQRRGVHGGEGELDAPVHH